MDDLIANMYSNLGFELRVNNDFARIMLVLHRGTDVPVFSSQEELDQWVTACREEFENEAGERSASPRGSSATGRYADEFTRRYMSMPPTDIKGVSNCDRTVVVWIFSLTRDSSSQSRSTTTAHRT